MSGFTKLFSSITASTIWQEPDATRLVWITMLAMADQNGVVSASVPGLAMMARVPLDACVEALSRLSSPDQWSRTPDHEGRRIEAVGGGWRLLNHSKYRTLRDAEHRREQVREAVSRHRAKKRGDVITDDYSNQSKPRKAQAEAEAEAEAEAYISLSDAKASKRERASPAKPTRRSPEIPLPSDWQPNPQHYVTGKKLGLDEADVLRIADAMRDWAATHEHRRRSWDAQFSSFMRNDEKYGKRPSKQPNGISHGEREARERHDAILEGGLRSIGYRRGEDGIWRDPDGEPVAH